MLLRWPAGCGSSLTITFFPEERPLTLGSERVHGKQEQRISSFMSRGSGSVYKIYLDHGICGKHP